MEAMRQYNVMTEEGTMPTIGLAPKHRLEDKPTRQRVYYAPDEDFYRGITVDELLVGIHKDIERMYARKKCG